MVSPIPLPNFLTISFYTDRYADVVRVLADSLFRFNMPSVIKRVEDQGGWLANVNYKPTFIYEEWKKSDRPILWVDADAVINQLPIFFNHLENEDMAAHFRNQPPRYRNELLSGTLFFNKTPGAEMILSKWVEATKRNANQWDQRVLQEVVETSDDFSIFRLPSAYTKIFDTMDGDAVIEHFQHSREVKKSG